MKMLLREKFVRAPITPTISLAIAAVVVLFAFFGVGGALVLLHKESVVHHFYFFLLRRAEDDSWKPMRMAYESLKSPHEGTLDLYQYLFSRHTKFQYSPTSLLTFAIGDALNISVSNRNLSMVGWLSVIGEAMVVGALTYEMAGKGGWNGRVRVGASMLAGLMCLFFYPVLKGYSLGQVQAWLSAWFALACYCWLVGFRSTAGILIGGSPDGSRSETE